VNTVPAIRPASLHDSQHVILLAYLQALHHACERAAAHAFWIAILPTGWSAI
jgi:hypothetical protein